MASIVVGYDGSACGEAALDAALGLAPPLGDEVTVVFGYAPPGIWGGEIADHEEAIEELGESVLGKAREQASRRGVEIGEQLFLSTRTVETHRAHIQQKLRRTTRAELVRYALEHGLVDV